MLFSRIKYKLQCWFLSAGPSSSARGRSLPQVLQKRLHTLQAGLYVLFQPLFHGIRVEDTLQGSLQGLYQCTPPGQQAVGETEASQTLRGMGVLAAMSTEGAGLEGLALVTARWVSPESLRLNVPDHDRVDELSLTVVGAEPARHIPAVSTGVLGTTALGIIWTRSVPPRNPQDMLWWPESVQGGGKVPALLGQLTPAPRAQSTQTGAGSKGKCIRPRVPCKARGPEPLTGLALAVRPRSCTGAGRLG